MGTFKVLAMCLMSKTKKIKMYIGVSIDALSYGNKVIFIKGAKYTKTEQTSQQMDEAFIGLVREG